MSSLDYIFISTILGQQCIALATSSKLGRVKESALWISIRARALESVLETWSACRYNRARSVRLDLGKWGRCLLQWSRDINTCLRSVMLVFIVLAPMSPWWPGLGRLCMLNYLNDVLQRRQLRPRVKVDVVLTETAVDNFGLLCLKPDVFGSALPTNRVDHLCWCRILRLVERVGSSTLWESWVSRGKVWVGLRTLCSMSWNDILQIDVNARFLCEAL